MLKKLYDRLIGQSVKRDKEILAAEEKACGKEQTLFLMTQDLAKECETTTVRVTQMLDQIKEMDKKENNNHD